MSEQFSLTPRQAVVQSTVLASGAKHVLLEGGSRSGKTFLLTRAVVARAVKAPGSRHAIFRLRFNHVKASIVLDTFPRVMERAFLDVRWELNKTDWYVTLWNGSEIWFGGLDEKDRTEKVLGQEHATLYFNEVTQIPFGSRCTALTRLAQRVEQRVQGRPAELLAPREYADCNPTSKTHWAYKLFHQGIDPETGRALMDAAQYAHASMSPDDNVANVSPEYIGMLRSMPERMQRRFYRGDWAEATPDALFTDDVIDKWRETDGRLPDMVRLVVAVDPSGASDDDAEPHDAIGIVVAGLGTDGNAYVLEDCTVSAGPATWGRIAAQAYDRHAADVIVGEENFGGAMVRHVIQTARPRTPYKHVRASRGKAVRAEPFSALYEQGRIRHAGMFRELEDELCGFTKSGYVGAGSPNRADALIWALAELFPAMVTPQRERKPERATPLRVGSGSAAWMS